MRKKSDDMGIFEMFFVSFIAVALPVVSSLEILDIEGPSVVVNGSTSQVVLDCYYDITEHDKTGLVVKWFFNRQPIPVYQWIPDKVPQDLGILKGRLNLKYEVSDDHFAKHRALAIVNPTTDLTGEYTCVISSFASEDSKRKKLIVYAPAEDLVMTYTKPSEDSVVVTCRAGGIYPAPNIAIFRSSSSSRDNIEGAKVESQHFPDLGYYNISLELEVSDYELDAETMFECVLTIPETDYRVQEEILYLPGHLTTEEPSTTPDSITISEIEEDELLEEYENIEYIQDFEIANETNEAIDDNQVKKEYNDQPHTAESVSCGERLLSSMALLSLLLTLLHYINSH